MPFDDTRYVEVFIKKHRSARLVAGDLVSRYAITFPATDTEIRERLKTIRDYWNRVSLGDSMTARIARMCLAEDKRLRAEHGAEMETSQWWRQRQSARQLAISAAVESAAASLRGYYGSLGMITDGILDKVAAEFSLANSQARRAAEIARLRVVSGVSRPDAEPISGFADLIRHLSDCGVASVPELVHPDGRPFSIADQYACRDDPSKLLDKAAVAAQIAAIGMYPISSAANARLAALQVLRRALETEVDLRDVALYHLMTVARSFPSPSAAAAELRKRGLEPADATIVALLAAGGEAVAGEAAPPTESVTRPNPEDDRGDRVGRSAIIGSSPHTNAAEPLPAPDRINAIPRKAQPVRELRARVVGSDQETRVQVSWTPVDDSEVRIVRTDGTAALWPFGAMISAEEMTGANAELNGERFGEHSTPRFEVFLPSGVHHLVPLSADDTGFVVGAGVTVTVVLPVNYLSVTPFATLATVSWEWPLGIHFVQLTWKLDGKTKEDVISKERYRSEGGAHVPLGHGPCDIEVRAVIMAHGNSFSSPPKRTVIDETATESG
jgi:hypothetical protein